MPLFIDIHMVPGVTSQIAAAEHVKDLEVQSPLGVNYSKYWLNEQQGKIFCLCEAPDAETAITVHRMAHGEVAEQIIDNNQEQKLKRIITTNDEKLSTPTIDDSQIETTLVVPPTTTTTKRYQSSKGKLNRSKIGRRSK